jgi:cell division protein FtsB
MVELKSLLGVFFLLLAAVFYFKNKADQKAGEAEIAELKGKDSELKKQQDAVKSEIDKVEGQDDSTLTNEQRADRWNK